MLRASISVNPKNFEIDRPPINYFVRSLQEIFESMPADVNSHKFFHQTSPKVAKKIRRHGFVLPKKKRASNTDYMMPYGVFVKPTDHHIALPGSCYDEQIPVQVETTKVMNCKDRGYLELWLIHDSEFESISTKVKSLYAAMHQVSKAGEIKAIEKEYLAAVHAGRARVTQMLTDGGWDALYLADDPGPLFSWTETLVVLDPTKVKPVS